MFASAKCTVDLFATLQIFSCEVDADTTQDKWVFLHLFAYQLKHICKYMYLQSFIYDV